MLGRVWPTALDDLPPRCTLAGAPVTDGVVTVVDVRDRGGQRVVLRTLSVAARRDGAARLAFERGAAALEGLELRGTARLVQRGRTKAGTPYVLEAWHPGESLEAQRVRDGFLRAGDALAVVAQGARVLQVAASLGLHHGDLRPDDLFLTPDGQLIVRRLGYEELHAWARRETPVGPPHTRDVRALAGCLFRLATGVDAEAPEAGLAASALPRELASLLERARGRDPTLADGASLEAAAARAFLPIAGEPLGDPVARLRASDARSTRRPRSLPAPQDGPPRAESALRPAAPAPAPAPVNEPTLRSAGTGGTGGIGGTTGSAGSAAGTTADDLPAGTRVGRYLVEGPASFGNGAVRATDTVLGRAVVLKIVRARRDAGAAGRLLLDARCSSRILHPGVLAVFDAGVHAQLAFAAFEDCRGRALRALLDEGATLAVLPLLASVAAAMDACHDAGITHGAVDADHIVVTATGAAKLHDFSRGGTAEEGTNLATGPDQRAWGLLARELLGQRRADADVRLNGAAIAVLERTTAATPEARFPRVSAAHDALAAALGVRATRRLERLGRLFQRGPPDR